MRLTEGELQRIIVEALNDSLSDESRAIQSLDTYLSNVRQMLGGSLDGMWSTFVRMGGKYNKFIDLLEYIDEDAKRLKKHLEMAKMELKNLGQ